MLQIVAGIFGLVHLLWFGVPGRFITIEDLPCSTKVLAGRIDVGATGIRIAGLLWLAATLLWVAAGLGLVFSAPWWPGMTVAAALSEIIGDVHPGRACRGAGFEIRPLDRPRHPCLGGCCS